MACWEAYQEGNADLLRDENNDQDHWINAFDHRQGVCLICDKSNCSPKNGQSLVCPCFWNLCINDIALLEPSRTNVSWKTAPNLERFAPSWFDW